MNQNQFWIATNNDKCCIFCSIDDEVLFKKLAEPVFNEISGPYKNELMQEITDNLTKKYAANQISLEYENWVELLNELKEPDQIVRKETKLDQYWIGLAETFCYVFCAIDDVETFKEMAQPLFDSIAGPFKRQTFEKDAKLTLERYEPLQILYSYDNWKELLTLMDAFNDIDVDETQDGSYFAIKINDHRYDVFYGTKEAALEKCKNLKCSNDVNDECSLLHSCEGLTYHQALDKLLKWVDITL